MHHHINGLDGLISALYVIAILGVFNLLAMKYRNKSSLAAAWANVFGVA